MAEVKADWIDQHVGEYHLVQFLGRGSFGDVYLGEHTSDANIAAVKILNVRLTDKNDIKSFINEARTIRLIHEHIIRILDFGISEDDTPFIVMEYAPNGTLRHRHARGTRLPLTTVVEYVKQIADALQYAHNRRLIHRDVKPENILLGVNFEILLSDFGIATVAHRTHSARTEDKAGTVHYMAPEQLQGKSVLASDQYALGIVSYEWLCGEYPFKGNSLEIALQHSIAPPPSLCEQVPELPPEVEQVVMRALAKDPKDRFPNVLAFANALEEAAQPRALPGQTHWTYSNHRDEIRTVAWSPDTLHIASGSSDKTVQVWLPVWRNATIESVDTTVIYEGHTRSVNALTWSPDGQRIASASLDGTVHVWDVATGDILLSYAGHTGWVRAVAWSPDGNYLASGAWDGCIQLWDAETGKLLSTYSRHVDEVRAIAWSPDRERILSGAADKTALLWDANTCKTLLTYAGHTRSVNAVAWSPDGRRVASGSLDGTVQVWDANDGEMLLTYTGHSSGVNALAWSPDGRCIASGGRDNTVQIWEAFTGKHLYTYSAHTDWVMALCWSFDGRHIASGSVDTTIHIWQARR